MLTLTELYSILESEYGNLNWWPAKNVFEMMCGAVLTQNTAWSNVERAIARFEGRLSPDYIRETDSKKLAEIIRPAGFFNQKAERLKILAEWYSLYADKVHNVPTEKLREELLSLKGVGKETADSILVYGFGRTSFVVDAYTRRLLARIGYELPQDYDDIRRIIESFVKKDNAVYNQFHALIVEHCKCRCKKKPMCNICFLSDFCKYFKTVYSKSENN